MRANKKNKKVPKAQTGMLIASMIPQGIAAYQGYKAMKDAKKEEANIKAMMPSLTSQRIIITTRSKRSY